MLLNINNFHKSIGSKELFDDLSLKIYDGQKVALIGRNGMGKTTLFKVITGEDKDYTGEIGLKKGIRIIMTRQEHFLSDDVTALDYILEDVPKYKELLSQIRHHEENLTSDMDDISAYTDTIMEFSEFGYYEIEDKIISALESFQIGADLLLNPLSSFSGGQKRFVELVRVMFSGADLALIDEPTNHMDYIGKELFIKWFEGTKQTLIVVTHDRDVLHYADRILELKEKKIIGFDGNYDNYLKLNNNRTVNDITAYETQLKKISDTKRKLDEAAKRKAYKSGKIVYERILAEYKRLQEGLVKPSFWIDQESLDSVSDKTVESYNKFKEKNINIRTAGDVTHKKELLKIDKLSVGYFTPLFSNVNFHMYHGDRVFIKGRNGAGKSTLIKTIISKIPNHNGELDKEKSQATIFSGEFKFNSQLKLGVYEQEIDHRYINMTLSNAIYDVYDKQNQPINSQKIQALLGNYLFDPARDGNLTIDKLSGGQKARFQLIKMLSNEPNLLILDEPTNHLDLPSIEQLENILQEFHGAIIYVTHDNYLMEKLGGRVIEI